ncbi:winged helix-turn-helix domain-containing protein [Fibrobacter sp. UWOV1]|uniref:winged helix-turn-helix domain-containing protein n=1 Tax=Fibrobacter sp. UWOV1 TaxID=1896215 RepID=UPI00093243AF
MPPPGAGNKGFTQKTTQYYPIPPNPTQSHPILLNPTQKTTQKTTQKILDAISNNPNVTRLELSEICGITADGVKWQLRNLTKSGRIARIGGDRGGHWEVHDVEHPKT